MSGVIVGRLDQVGMMDTTPPLEPHDVRLLQRLRALPDRSLDRASAHLAAGLPLRRADLGWTGQGPASDGCLVGVSMSRWALLRQPLRIPSLLLLAASFDAWAYEEIRRHGSPADLRGRRLPPTARARLGQLLDLEHRRRHGWGSQPRPGTPKAEEAELLP